MLGEGPRFVWENVVIAMQNRSGEKDVSQSTQNCFVKYLPSFLPGAWSSLCRMWNRGSFWMAAAVPGLSKRILIPNCLAMTCKWIWQQWRHFGSISKTLTAVLWLWTECWCHDMVIKMKQRAFPLRNLTLFGPPRFLPVSNSLVSALRCSPCLYISLHWLKGPLPLIHNRTFTTQLPLYCKLDPRLLKKYLDKSNPLSSNHYNCCENNK